jgi:transcription elongation factor GreA
VWWAPTSAPEEYEDALLSAFAQGISPAAKASLRDASVVLPFGNLQTATNERKQHGIRGSLLADAPDTPATTAERGAAAAAAARGNGSGGQRSGPDPTRRTGVLRSSPARPRSATPRAATGSRAAAAALKAAGRPAGPAVQLSAEGLLALQAELADLTMVQRPAIVARIAAARELGDLKENSDYHEARREQSFAEGRVLQLEDQLRNAVVVEGGGGTVVAIGSTVVVERIDAAGALETTTFKIVGAAEASPKTDRISNVSPIGAALIGRSAGEAVEVVIPSGRIGFRILEVR